MSRHRRSVSVRVRITVVATIVLAAGLIGGGVLLVQSLRTGLLDAQSGSGPEIAAELSARAGQGPLPAVLPELDAARGTLLQVIDANGTVSAASQQLSGLPPLSRPTDRHRDIRHEIAGLGDGPWLVEPTPATLGGRPVVVVVVTSLTDYERSADVMRNRLLISLPVLVALVAVLIWFVVGRALRPVETMRREVERISSERLDERITAPAIDDEIGKLATTLNDMLSRLERSAAAQRRFVGDASHELRTPVANISVAMEVASAHPARTDWQRVIGDVLGETARMERLTEDLLFLSRTGATEVEPQREPVGLDEVVGRELGRHSDATVRVVAGTIAPVSVIGDRFQLASVVSNLVDNAIRHARSTVVVSLVAGAAWAELRIADDGPGIPVDQRRSVFEPFVRLDQHRNREQGGAGLGLAIVQTIVRAHHGTVRITDNEPGALFIVRLPVSGSSQEQTSTLRS